MPTVSFPELTSGRAARLQSAAVEPASPSPSAAACREGERQRDGQEHGEQDADTGAGRSDPPAGGSAATAHPEPPGIG